MSFRPKSYGEQLRELVREYRAAGEPWPADSKQLASWMIKKKKWHPTRKNAIDLLAPQVSRAMAEDFFTDPQDRRVRRMHAVRESVELDDGTHRQHSIWVEMDDPATSREQMQNAFQHRRGQVLGDCRQLKTDVDSYNDNNNPGPTVEMLWDFTDDLLEMEQSTEYDPSELDDEDRQDRNRDRVAPQPGQGSPLR